jgi:hypothetical protein
MKFIFLLISVFFILINKGITQDKKQIKYDFIEGIEKNRDSIFQNLSFTINEYDTVVFDLLNSNFNSDYFEFPITVLSDDSIYSLDFSFEFNNNNYIFDTLYPLISPLQYLSHFNESDLRFRFTSNSLSQYPTSSPIVFVGFSILDFSFCELNIFQPIAYLNGEPCSVLINPCPEPTLLKKANISKAAYPNPVIDELFLEQPPGSKVTITDNVGKIVYERLNDIKSASIKMDNLLQGLYFVSLETQTSVFTHKIIVSK